MKAAWMLTIFVFSSFFSMAISGENNNKERVGDFFVHVGYSSGVFGSSVIHKLVDKNEGIVCYIHSPKNISIKTRCSDEGCSDITDGDVGSISCVKL